MVASSEKPFEKHPMDYAMCDDACPHLSNPPLPTLLLCTHKLFNLAKARLDPP
jgi:hypothetical protein